MAKNVDTGAENVVEPGEIKKARTVLANIYNAIK